MKKTYAKGFARCPKCSKTIERVCVYENNVLIGFSRGECSFCGFKGDKKIDPVDNVLMRGGYILHNADKYGHE